MQKTNEIMLERQGTAVIFNIQGDITSFSEPVLNKAYQEANEPYSPQIILRVENGTYINSGGIAVLIQILAQAKKNKQTVSITGLSDHFKKIFSMVGITKFSEIHNSVEDALAAMPKPQL